MIPDIKEQFNTQLWSNSIPGTSPIGSIFQPGYQLKNKNVQKSQRTKSNNGVQGSIATKLNNLDKFKDGTVELANDSLKIQDLDSTILIESKERLFEPTLKYKGWDTMPKYEKTQIIENAQKEMESEY